MDSTMPRGGVKGRGISGFRDLGTGDRSGAATPPLQKSPNPPAAPCRARCWRYPHALALLVEQDLDDAFRTFVRSGRGDEYPFRSRLLPPKKFFFEAQADLDSFARHKGLGLLGDEPACRICGCTEGRACCDAETGECCHWVEADLCSACEGKEVRSEESGVSSHG